MIVCACEVNFGVSVVKTRLRSVFAKMRMRIARVRLVVAIMRLVVVKIRLVFANTHLRDPFPDSRL